MGPAAGLLLFWGIVIIGGFIISCIGWLTGRLV